MLKNTRLTSPTHPSTSTRNGRRPAPACGGRCATTVTAARVTGSPGGASAIEPRSARGHAAVGQVEQQVDHSRRPLRPAEQAVDQGRDLRAGAGSTVAGRRADRGWTDAGTSRASGTAATGAVYTSAAPPRRGTALRCDLTAKTGSAILELPSPRSPSVDDTLELREQLSLAWRAVLDGVIDKGSPAPGGARDHVTGRARGIRRPVRPVRGGDLPPSPLRGAAQRRIRRGRRSRQRRGGRAGRRRGRGGRPADRRDLDRGGRPPGSEDGLLADEEDLVG